MEVRKKLSNLLKPKSLVVVHSNDVYPTSADGHMSFIQNSDFYYLTGIDQEESVLLFFPEAEEPQHRVHLFIRETNEHIAIWEGEKLTKQEASDLSGIPVQAIHWTQDFDATLKTLAFQAESIYLNSNEHGRANCQVPTKEFRFIRECQERFPLHQYRRLAPLLHQLRSYKSGDELNAISEAIAITEVAFRRVLHSLKPGMAEYEIEAEIIYEFIRNGAQGHAYQPIIASGKNACVLHYIDNHCTCDDGELLLLDFGARYANYNADLTRTIPVNGRYTTRQRQVYNAVLRVHNAAKELLSPGLLLKEYQEKVGLIMQEELLELGLLTKEQIQQKSPSGLPAYKKYFMHGTSHFLGLDVHDVGNVYRPIEAGMVFTVEPGIYIREEGIGIRIENNVLITPDGCLDLMEEIPIEADEIEDLMNSK